MREFIMLYFVIMFIIWFFNYGRPRKMLFYAGAWSFYFALTILFINNNSVNFDFNQLTEIRTSAVRVEAAEPFDPETVIIEDEQ